MKILTQKDLISSLQIDSNIMFLLGAGCSISSGCMAASSLVKEFKVHLYCRDNKVKKEDVVDYYEKEFLKKLNEDYPDKDNNYSYYFEKCYPIAKDRNRFIKNNFIDKNPSLGYLCFAYYIISNKIPYILTTNFDNLIEKSIQQIDTHYDLVPVSDRVQAYLNDGKTNLLKLHGDYNYDPIQNTEDELKQLHDNMVKLLNDIKVNKLVVIGYSGYDESVMNAIENYIKQNSSIEIFWCVINKNEITSPKVSELYNYNFNLVEIEGFDQLFNDYYKIYLPKNDIIECYFNKEENEKFFFSKPLNKFQKIITNGYPLIREPIVYEYDVNKYNIDLDAEKTLIRYKEKYYGYSSSYCPMDKGLKLSDVILPLDNKKEILKKYLIHCFKNKNLNIYKSKVFKNKCTFAPFPCLKFDITIVNNKFTLTLLPSYTFGKEPNSEEYSIINSKVSNLFAKQHNKLLNDLINENFNNFDFVFDKISFSFSNKPYTTFDSENILDYYTFINEPKMVINFQQNKNQIGLLQTIGPEVVPFSPDTIKIGVICCTEKKQILWDNFLKKLINGSLIPSKTDLIQQFPGFEKLLKKKIEFVKYDNYKLSVEQLKAMNQNELLAYLLEWINSFYRDNQVDLIIVFFSNEMENFRKVENVDFHDYIKFKCLNKYKTQIIEESTLNSADDINKILFNLALGIYTKTIGISWKPLEFSNDNFYLGMSFGITDNGIHVGCSQLFDGAGRGMQLLVLPIENKNVRKNPYLSKEEAYALGRKVRSVYYKASKPFDLNNIVIHRTTPYRSSEIEGFKQAFKGLKSFNLIQIVEYTDFNGYATNIYGAIDGYPIRRGSVLKLSNREILVWTDGSVYDEEVMHNKTYRSSKRGIGRPILIKKFYGNDSIEKIASDILKLTKMDMNSTEVLYSRLPVTLKYAKVLCNLLKQGDIDETDDLINFQYIM